MSATREGAPGAARRLSPDSLSVTIHPDRAVVSRRAEFGIGDALSCAEFGNLGVGVVAESVRARVVSGGGRVVSATHEERPVGRFLEDEHEAVRSEALARLSGMIETLDERAVLALGEGIVSELREYLSATMNALLLDPDTSVTKVREAMDFLSARAAGYAVRSLSLKDRYAELGRELAILRERLGKIASVDRKWDSSIIVLLDVRQAGTVTLEITYSLPNATWKPEYDSRIDPVSGRVELSCHGAVRQSTGESWNDARVSLATGTPDLDPAIPAVYPVTFVAEARKRTRTLTVEEEETDSVDDAIPESAAYPEAEPPEAPEGGEVGKPKAAGTAERGMYEAVSLASVASDGEWHRVPLAKAEFAAETGYECVPETLERVFLKATFPNSLGFPLLEGENALFRNGSFVGKARFSRAAAGSRIAMSFGIDDDLRVSRAITRDELKPAGILGRQVWTRTIKFLLWNHKEAPVRVRLREAVHVSELREVTVTVDEATTPGWERDADGILSWTVEVAPDPYKPEVRELTYRVEAAKSFDLAALR